MTPTIVPFPALTGNPGQSSWALRRKDGRLESPLAGTFQDIVRTGYRWEADLTWQVLAQKDSQRLGVWAAQMARGGLRCYMPNFAFSPLGALGIAELISNGTNLLNTTGWTAGASAVLSANNGQLAVFNGAGGSAGVGITPVTCVVGQTYVVVAVFTAGSTSSGQVLIGTTAGGTQVSVTTVSPGYIFITF